MIGMRHATTKLIVLGTCSIAFGLCCAGLHERVLPPNPAIAVTEDASLAIAFAAEHASSAADAVFRAQIERHFEEANALTVSVANAVLSVRAAVPTTRTYSPSDLDAARDYIAVAQAHLSERGVEPVWLCAPQARCVGQATELLTTASRLLDECEDSRPEDADITYERVFELYETWRESTAALAESAAEDPIGTWNTQVDGQPDDH
jgi:hypothetical protein